MLRFIAVRLLQTIPVLFVVATVTFFMVRSVPGGPFDTEKVVAPEIKRQLESYYGLDKPLWQQYTDYMVRLSKGDLGPSLKYTNRTVKEMILDTFPTSMRLGLISLAIALVFGITAGVMAALKPNTLLDYFASSVSIFGICLPTFVTGPILVLVFALNFRWFNASGINDAGDYVLPAIALGFAYAAYVSRMTRGGMLEVMNQDYIRTARAKGAGETRVVLSHALRGGLLPVVSFLGPATAGIMTGSFVIESIFQIPGIGRHFVTSVFNRDHTMVIGTALFFAALLVVLNLVVDVVLVWLNPKLKLQ